MIHPISHPRTRLNGILAFAPCLCLLALWLIAATFGEFRLFHFTLGRTLAEVSSTSWRALEVAVVSNPAFVREAPYCVLPKAYPPIGGMYLGPVAVAPPGRGVLVLLPYYAMFLAAAACPAVIFWRAFRRRVQARGFAVRLDVSSSSQVTTRN